MFLLQPFRGLFRRSARGRRGRANTLGQHRRTRRLALEVLEDRTVPSLFLVNTLADGGPGSLRQAVLDANTLPGPDAIRFADGLGSTIVLTSGQLTITDDLTIDGPGADRLAVSGNDAIRVF